MTYGFFCFVTIKVCVISSTVGHVSPGNTNLYSEPCPLICLSRNSYSLWSKGCVVPIH